MSSDPTDIGVAAALRAITTGALTPEALLEACLARIAREAEVLAWQALGADAASALARREPAGLLGGIPFGVKDIVDTHDFPTGLGTAFYDGHRPARDAGCVALLREAGAICLGKTVATELGHLTPNATRNPLDPAHTPGGSSSGSAAAVAAGMVPFALGTQTTGSTLRPASFCGIVGYKPSFGEVTRSGIFEAATSFDTVGVLCRELEDLPLVRAALLRLPPAVSTPPAIRGLRLGTWRDDAWDKASPAMQAAVDAAIARLAAAGAAVVELDVPPAFTRIDALHRIVSGFEFTRAASFERLAHGHALSPTLREGRMRAGESVTLEAYHAAQDELAGLRSALAERTAEVDVLVTPAALGEAPSGLASTGDAVLNTVWTALHVPALTFPVATGPAGLPLGVQLVGKARGDNRLIALAQVLRAAL